MARARATKEDFGSKLCISLRRWGEMEAEFRKLKKTLGTMRAEGISDTNRDEFNQLTKMLDSYGKELKEMKSELMEAYLARPKDVEDVVEEKEELVEQVGPEPNTL